MAEVQLQNVEKHYLKRRNALREVNLSIKDREFTVLLGPSGCGKSTLLRVIAGLEKVSGGEIRIDQKRVNDVPPAERDIAMVFQDYALYPHMTVKENLSFGLRMRGADRETIETQVKMAAELLELKDLLARKPSQLSGGQRQRVAIGRAIVRHPKVFLFDEPLSNLDAQLRTQTRAELADLHKRVEATTIYVTHDQVEAMTLADRIVVLSQGRIRQIGTPQEIYHSPADKFVAGFVGYPSMNLIDGELRGGEFEFEGAKLRLTNPPAIAGKVTMGIRPEFTTVVENSNEAGDLEGRLTLIEFVGNEENSFVRVGRSLFAIRSSGQFLADRLDAGDKVKLSLDPHRIQWFEPGEEGKRILV